MSQATYMPSVRLDYGVHQFHGASVMAAMAGVGLDEFNRWRTDDAHWVPTPDILLEPTPGEFRQPGTSMLPVPGWGMLAIKLWCANPHIVFGRPKPLRYVNSPTVRAWWQVGHERLWTSIDAGVISRPRVWLDDEPGWFRPEVDPLPATTGDGRKVGRLSTGEF